MGCAALLRTDVDVTTVLLDPVGVMALLVSKIEVTTLEPSAVVGYWLATDEYEGVPVFSAVELVTAPVPGVTMDDCAAELDTMAIGPLCVLVSSVVAVTVTVGVIVTYDVITVVHSIGITGQDEIDWYSWEPPPPPPATGLASAEPQRARMAGTTKP